MATILETPRLRLRHLETGDFDALYALYSDPEIRRHFPEGTLDREQTRAELEWFLHGHPQHPQLGLWAAIHRQSGAFMGRSGLLPWTIDDALEVEVAYLFGQPWWRQGYGREVAQALVRHAFDTLDVVRLIVLTDPANHASIRTAESVGFRHEREVVIGGVASALYSLQRAAWHASGALRQNPDTDTWRQR